MSKPKLTLYINPDPNFKRTASVGKMQLVHSREPESQQRVSLQKDFDKLLKLVQEKLPVSLQEDIRLQENEPICIFS